jgi:hypothetical protein
MTGSGWEGELLVLGFKTEKADLSARYIHDGLRPGTGSRFNDIEISSSNGRRDSG